MTLSSFINWLFCGDHRMSLCGAALEKCEHAFWRGWVRAWGIGHCVGSWMHHRLRVNDDH